MTKKVFYIVVILLLSGCVTLSTKLQRSDIAGGYYRVKPRDSLAQISSKYNVSADEIIFVNGLKNSSIKPGQIIFIPQAEPIKAILSRSKPQKTKKEAKPIEKCLLFPVKNGQIIKNFSRTKKDPYDGIAIKAKMGSQIAASQNGKVLFVGNDGTKFGLLVIIEHKNSLITVYTHLNTALVKTEQVVKKGQIIGTVGKSGGIPTPMLHFQVRVDQKPQDPKIFLNYE